MQRAPHIPNYQYGLSVVTASTAEPIDIDTAKRFLRVEIPDDDTLIASFISAATAFVENKLDRTLINRTWRLTLDDFPCGADGILIPKPPISTSSSNVSITYIDSNGASTTLASTNYTVDVYSEPARIYPAYGYTWPTNRDLPNAVTVQFVAGYGATVDTVPAGIRAYMLRVIAEMYENREMNVVGTIASEYPQLDGLLDPYRYSLQCG